MAVRLGGSPTIFGATPGDLEGLLVQGKHLAGAVNGENLPRPMTGEVKIASPSGMAR